MTDLLTWAQGRTWPVPYADPPWPYRFSRSKRRRVERHFHTMSVDEIAAEPVADIAERNAVLFLWGTAPKRREAQAVMAAWGFEYVTDWVWDKRRTPRDLGAGYWGRVNHEYVLIGRRGKRGVTLVLPFFGPFARTVPKR